MQIPIIRFKSINKFLISDPFLIPVLCRNLKLIKIIFLHILQLIVKPNNVILRIVEILFEIRDLDLVGLVVFLHFLAKV